MREVEVTRLSIGRIGTAKGWSGPGRWRCVVALASALGAVCTALAGCASNSGSSGGSASAAPAGAGSFAASHFTTKLAGTCPNPLVVQTNWLPEPDHAPLYELIGGGGTLSQYSYEGPLGSTGIKLRILAGGPGSGNLDGPTVLYAGNPVLGVTPDLAMDSIDVSIQESKKFPTIAVDSFQEHDPLVLIYDPTKFHNLNSISSLIAAAHAGAHFYVSSLQTIYVPFLIDRGVPQSAFIAGYQGDLDKFISGGGMVINQGYVTSEPINLEHFISAWHRPVGYTFIYKLGLNDYDEVIQVPKNKLAAMTPCLSKLVPMLQQAAVDYIKNPKEVNDLIARYNSSGYGAPYWKTPPLYCQLAVKAMIGNDIVANSAGGSGPIGALDMARVSQVINILLPLYARLGSNYQPGLVASDIATDKFIDPSIKLPPNLG
ncbi:MAG TPA: hypothetical protein VKY15_07620 [Acidimicrobiales bacterium]|nr:hypothetical protein [Acidimicrobiales bacterium]